MARTKSNGNSTQSNAISGFEGATVRGSATPQIPVCLWFLVKNEPIGKCRAVSELDLALAA